MKLKRSILAAFLGCLAIILVATPIMAYSYYGAITVVESNGTSYPMVGVSVPVSNSALVSGGYITSTGLDTAVKNSGAASMPHMLVTDKVLFASQVNASNSAVFNYEMGNAPISAFSIVTGYNGYITTADAAALEPANNFEIEISGYFDTSTAGKYIVKKDGALELYTSAAGEITGKIYTGTGTAYTLGASNADWDIYGARYDMQNFTTGASGAIVTSATLYTQKVGSPAGNFVINLYATTAGKPSGASLGSVTVAASTISGSAGDTTLTFASPITLAANTLYALVATCTSGDVSNYVTWFYYNMDMVANADAGYSLDSGATWSLSAGSYDHRGSINIITSKTVVGTGIASGVHTIKFGTVSTNLKLYDGATEKASTAMAGASATNNANNFIWLNNNSCPYATYIKYTVGGALVVTYQPVTIISGTTMPDTTGTAQDGVITFGSNPAGVTVSIGSLSSAGSSYTAPADTNINPAVVPGQSQPMSAGTGVAASPFYPFFDAIYVASGNTLSPDLQAMMFAAVFAVGFAIVGGVASQGRSFFLVIAGLGVGAGLGYALRFYQDVWVLYVLVVLSIAALLLDARKSW